MVVNVSPVSPSTSAAIVVGLVLSGVSWCCAAQPDDSDSSDQEVTIEVKDLIQRHEDRSQFFGKIYTYQIEYTSLPDGHPLHQFKDAVAKGKRTLILGHAGDRNKPVPYLMKQYAKNPGEAYLPNAPVLMCWEGFDGTETRTFGRTLFGNNPRAKFFEHVGYVNQTPTLHYLSSDPFLMVLFGLTSEFGRITGAKPVKWTPSPGLSVETEVRPPIGRVHRIVGGDSPGFEFSDGPEFHFLGGKPFHWRLESLARFGGISYPAAATYSHDKHMETSFKLLSVQDLDESYKNWFLDWPNGTAVINNATKKVDRVPYDAHEIAQIRLSRGDPTWKPPHELAAP